MPPLFAQAILESISLSRVTAAFDDAWRSLPREIRDAPTWTWLLLGAFAMLLFVRSAFRRR